jgi:hypothetical protein
VEQSSSDIRAEWVARQGLGTCGSVVDAARRAWTYQTGGSGAYLALRARVPGLRRADVDAAVASGELVILTGVRGCTFLVAAEHDPVTRAAWRERVEDSVRQLQPLGLDVRRFRRLCDELEELATEPTEPHTMRARVTSLQEIDAPRFGLKHTLPLAVRVLEGEGRLTRLPTKGRLDDERYAWRRTTPRPGDDSEPARVRGYVATTAPVSTTQVAAWLDTTAKGGRERLRAAGVRETGDGWRVDEVTPADDDRVSFLPLRDPFVDLRTRALVADDVADTVVDGWGKAPKAIGDQPTVHHHTIVWRGAIVGLWEWADGGVITGFFGEPPPAWKAEADALEAWIREELGDVFVYAQDGPKQREKRVAAVRSLG